jgi:hypothetical protein
VKWLNDPIRGTEELALVNNPIPDEEDVTYMRAGDEIESHRYYSHLVILAQVPKMVDREF